MGFRVARVGGTLFAVIAAVLLATALPAAAHNELQSSNPKSGATLDAAPASVVLTFAEDLIQGKTTITVVGPDGADAAAGPVQLSGTTATVALKPTAAGAYTVGFKVVADDGDVTDSSLKFTLTAAAVPAPTTTTSTTTTTTTTTTTPPTTSQVAPAAASSSSGTTWWPWVVGALVLILIVVGVVLLRRRGAGQTGTPSP